jgi:hypothetical protein
VIPVIDNEFGPATEHIRTGAGETDRLPARIGPQAQRKQIRETEWCLDVQSVVSVEPDAHRERRRGKALYRIRRA